MKCCLLPLRVKASTLSLLPIALLLMALQPGVAMAQAALEMQTGVGNTSGNGPSVLDQTVTLQYNTDNPTGNTFEAYTPAVTVTYSLSNQQYTGLTAAQGFPAGTGGNAVFFGGNPSNTTGTIDPWPIYVAFNALGSPANANFTSANPVAGQGIAITSNAGIWILSSARALGLQASPPSTSSRVQMADLTLTFNSPVRDPILHFVGMGGFGTLSTTLGMTSEFDLLTPGVTLTELSGNAPFVASASQVNNANTATLNVSCSANQAACGSARVNTGGNAITSVSFRVYLRGNGGRTTWTSGGNDHWGDAVAISVSLAPPSINGTVFQDTLGELLVDGAIGSAANPALSGRTVRLFNAGGTQVATTTTAANGSYTFTGLQGGTYYVAVDAPTVNAAGNSTNILLEQTYAAAGAGNAGAAEGSSGYGPLCVGPAPGYTQQGATTTTNLATAHANGYCYGGRRGAAADAGTTALDGKEHVTRVVVGAADVTGVDFGFSPYVVTNVNDAGQGSIRQFALNAGNANAGGTYSMRVVPAVPTNASGGSGNWWRADLGTITASNNVLMTQFSRVTLFDGTPHSNTNGTTALDPMPGDMLPASTAVGNQGRTLGSIPRPDFMVNYTGAVTTNTVMINHTGSCAGSATRDIALNIVAANASALVQETCGQYTLDQTVLGARPDGTVATGGQTGGMLANPSTPVWTGPVRITHNYIANPSYGITLRNGSPAAADGILLEGNYITGSTSAGMTLERDGALVRGNLVTSSSAAATGIVDTINGTGGNTITENTVTANGINIHLNKPNETATFNVLTNATGTATFRGAGIVAQDSNSIRISQNTFGGNNSNAIDLNRNGVTIATAGGGDCPSSGVANGGVARPRITSATYSGSTLTVSGFYCNVGTHTLELYRAGGNANGDTGSDGLVAGEGVEYLGSLTGLSGGTFTNQSIPTSALSAGTQITAISIRTDGAAGSTLGNTSEFSVNTPVSSARLTLAKTWVKAAVGNAANITLAGTPAPTGSGELASVANTADETDTGGTSYSVIAGNTYTIQEAFSVGSSSDYQKSLACTGNTGTGAALDYTANATSGTITIGQDATDIVCTFTNARVLADLSITKTNAKDSVVSGDSTTYTVVVSNAGPDSGNGAVAQDTPGAELSGCNATCTSTTGGAVCPASPGALLTSGGVQIATFPAGSSVTFEVTCIVGPTN